MLLAASLSAGEAQAQGLVWAKRAGGTAYTLGYSVALDGAGNSYVTGLFYGSSTFGPGEANQKVLTSATPSLADIFVAKYNSAGALQWARRAGGAESDWGYGIAVDSAGNSYVTGLFGGTANFEGSATTVISAGGTDIFVAKYNSAGTLLWAKSAGAAGSAATDEGRGIALDSSANPYVVGYFQSVATFGKMEANATNLTSAGQQDIFLAKFDSATGALAWATRAGGASNDQGIGVAVDTAGSGYVAGSFQVSATFGLGEVNATTLTGGGAEDIFIAKYTSAGALTWAKRAGGSGPEAAQGIALDAAANAYITGKFTGVSTFGTGGGTVPLTSAGGDDIFVAKYTTAGALSWAKRAGGSDVDHGYGIAVDSAGNSYITGDFNGAAQFGVGNPNATTLNTAGTVEDIFVAKYDTSGALAWATRAGGTSVDVGTSVAVKGSPSNIHVTGYFQLNSTFGQGEANQTTLNGTGVYNAFVAKYMDAPGSVNTATRVGIFNAGNWRLDSNGNGAPDDPLFSFNTAGATPITGDWNGDGQDEIGLFVNGFWFLDFDGNGVYDGGVVDKVYQFGWAGVKPYVGDWNGDGRDKIGIFINGFWFFDYDGNGVWGGPGVDRQAEFGWSAVTPFIGDWNGDGRDKIGIYINGFWYFDYNGNYLWDGPVTDRQAEFGWSAVTPFIGDWNGDGRDKIGIYINGFWFLDFDGNYLWDGPGLDTQAEFGFNGVTPIIGDWNGGGSDKIGIFINGIFYLDFDGSATWDGGVADKGYAYGQSTDTPMLGVW